MELSRRSFLKACGLAFAGSMAFELSGESKAFALDNLKEWKLENTQEFTSICGYCAGGCGFLASVRDGKIVNVEGDPDHFVSEGGLCPKGAAEMQLEEYVDPKTGELVPNASRIYSPKVRHPGSSQWEDISWDDAMEEIARHVKDTRDATFERYDANGVEVNRTQAIAQLGGSACTIEEDYFIQKFIRELGSITLDCQARV